MKSQYHLVKKMKKCLVCLCVFSLIKIADKILMLGVIIDGLIYVIGGSDGNQVLSDVQEYDTGFRPSQNVESKGKLSTIWGSKRK